MEQERKMTDFEVTPVNKVKDLEQKLEMLNKEYK
jgi:hypothetical protein